MLRTKSTHSLINVWNFCSRYYVFNVYILKISISYKVKYKHKSQYKNYFSLKTFAYMIFCCTFATEMKQINFIYRAKKGKQHRYKYLVVCTDGSVYEVPRERIAKVLYTKRILPEMLVIFEGLNFLWDDLL